MKNKIIFFIALNLILLSILVSANSLKGIGNPDNQCKSNGFDYGVVKYECEGETEYGSLRDISPTNFNWIKEDGECVSADWTSNSNRYVVLTKEARNTFVHQSLNNSINKTEKHSISHITFCMDNLTAVCGNIYTLEDMQTSLEGATVQVSCHHEENIYVLETSVSEMNDYCVFFEPSYCDIGDYVTASATFQGLYGSGSSYINEIDSSEGLIINFAIVDINMVPEFGVIVGLITLLGAVGIFFVVRR